MGCQIVCYDGFHTCIAEVLDDRISILVPVLEYLSKSTSTCTGTIVPTLKLMNTNKVRVPEIQYSSTASTSTEYEYPSTAILYKERATLLIFCYKTKI